MTKEATLSEAAIVDREPTALHKNFAQWIEDETGYKPDLKSVQIAASLRIKFQRSDMNQKDLAERKERAAAEVTARLARREAAAAKALESTEKEASAKTEKVAKKEAVVKKEASAAKKPAARKTRVTPKTTEKSAPAAALEVEPEEAPAPVKKTTTKTRSTRKPAAK